MNLTTLSTSHKWNHTLFVFCKTKDKFHWLISLIKMLSRFTRVVTFWRIFFLRLYNIPLYVSTAFCSSIHQLWTLCCFCVLAVVNNAAVNMGMKISLWYLAFNSSKYIPRIFFFSSFIFWGTIILFSTEAGTFYILSNNAQSLQFLHILISTCYLLRLELYEWSLFEEE